MPSFTLKQLCQTLGDLEFHGNGDTLIEGISSIELPRPGTLVFVEKPEQIQALESSEVAAILHPAGIEVKKPGLSHTSPRVLLARILEAFYPSPPLQPGIHPSASVDSRAIVSPEAQIGPFCVLSPGVQVHKNVQLSAFVVIGENSVIGQDSLLSAHVMIGTNCQIGKDCQLEAWARLGDEAILGDGVDLGAHSHIGCRTKIDQGCKVDNLVLVGPDCQIGPCSLLVGQSALEKNVVLKSGVIVAGQATVAENAVLHSGVQIGGRSWAQGEISEPGPYLGTPAIALKEEMRRRAGERKLARDKSSRVKDSE